MNITATLLTATFSLFLASVASAQMIIDKWTFDSATTQTGINGMVQNNWTTAGPNSVPSEGVLRYATSGNNNSASMAGGAIATSTISSLTLTVDLTDMNIANQVVFQFGKTGGAGNMEVEFNNFSSNNQFSLDVEGGGITLDPASILDQDNFSGAIPLVVAVTWDFENNLMSYNVTGSATAFESVTADLSGITSIDTFRVRGTTVADNLTYLDLNTVTIQTIPEPSSLMLLGLAFLAGIPMFRRLKR